ncbi:septum formation initiator family protein [Sphingomonas gilva]|uniref:Septum formation initiator family protein n=1 Tax=Sphingomonas gilva TaxID=2305907 RepID=A0A396RSI4_9SPHN|nr:septum formation initiator family protein [Sphingomonas gilva]RHW17303.1 septum formation initiator family protein [Sphingomonas gilva]
MRRNPKILALLKRTGAPAITFVVITIFAGYALFGSNGILAYGDYSRQMSKRQAELQKLEAKRAELKNRVALLDPKKANPDLVDELVRKQLNVAHPDDVILPLK